MRIAPWAAAFFAILGWGASIQQAEAANLFQKTFVESAGAPNCYLRAYDNKFLKSHPSLTVRQMAIGLSPTGPSDNVPNKANNFALNLAIQVKKNSTNYSALAFCKTKGVGFSCQIESDGGSFRVMPVGRDVRLISKSISIEGDLGGKDLSLTAPAGQTRSFLLKRANTNKCNEAYD